MKNPTHEAAPPLSAREFLALGMAGIAFIKPKLVDGQRRYAIHTADGAEVAVAEQWDEAMAMLRANELEPVSLH